MTKAQMIAAIKATGCTVRVIDGEIQVNIKGGTEATRYYTDDRQDAVDTAKLMAAQAAK